MGRLLDGKRSFEAGLAVVEKTGDKPELQQVMMEYGLALEAYHRERKLSNELYEAQRQKAVLELQGKYEADKRQRQIALLSRENQVKSAEIDNRRLQQRVWWLLAVVFAMALAMVGDAVLTMISENLREILRETDMIVRWGGEEFLAFLPAIPRSGVEEVARRLLSGISSNRIDYQGSAISVNVSIGFAPFPLSPGELALPWERAVNLVDMALYMAKGHGRNRAYGVRGFANFAGTSMEHIEQDLESAWRDDLVDLSVVLGSAPEAPAAVAEAAEVTDPA